jgi:toxin YhaV
VTRGKANPLVVDGWTLYAHPLFLEQCEALIKQVEALKRKDPGGYTRKNATKRLAAIARLALEIIPQDPSRPEYRQGATLGEGHKHWLRAKFYQQYRLFFRYHGDARIIVYAWVNDELTRRAYEHSDDAYRTFRRMLERGHPPGDWDTLLAEAKADRRGMQRLVPRKRPTG